MHVACEAREIRFEGRHVHARTALHERMSAPAQEWYESVTGPLQRWSGIAAGRVPGGRASCNR